MLRVVGKGQAWNLPGQELHNSPLPSNLIKVNVQIAIEPHATTPCPDAYGETTILADAVGCFIAWPSSHVGLDALTPQSSGAGPHVETRSSPHSTLRKSPIRECPAQVVTSPPVASTSTYLARLENYYNEKMQEEADVIYCTIAPGIVDMGEMVEWLDRNSLRSLLFGLWLDGSIMNVYCR